MEAEAEKEIKEENKNDKRKGKETKVEKMEWREKTN
jgi:hypothetical protein